MTRKSEETPGKERSNHTGDTDDKNGNCFEKSDGNKKGDITAGHRRADCKNESPNEGNTKEAREQDPERPSQEPNDPQQRNGTG